MEKEVELAEFTKIVEVVFGCVVLANLIELEQRILLCAIFDEKNCILNYLPKTLVKKVIKIVNIIFVPLKIKSTTLLLKTYCYYC